MIKQTRNRREFPQSDKGHLQKSTAIILNVERLGIPLRSTTREGTTIQQCTGSSSRII